MLIVYIQIRNSECCSISSQEGICTTELSWTQKISNLENILPYPIETIYGSGRLKTIAPCVMAYGNTNVSDLKLETRDTCWNPLFLQIPQLIFKFSNVILLSSNMAFGVV